MLPQQLHDEFIERHKLQLQLHERFVQEAREEKRIALPDDFSGSFYRKLLESIGIPAKTVWGHQAESLEAIASGLSAILTTATASGKSLIFQLATIFKLRKYDNATALVLYTTRALNNDQQLSWKKLMKAAGYREDELAVIDGSVKPVEKRLELLEKAKVVLATPDVIHAWMMTNLDKPQVQRFLSRLVMKTYDEGGNYERDFGARAASLHRRIEFAQRRFNRNFKPGDHDQTIIASATLSNPEGFANQFTGRDDFWHIGEDRNTSPRYRREFNVIRLDDKWLGGRENAVANFLASRVRKGIQGSSMTFIESHNRVDDMVREANRRAGRDVYVAYRGGHDRDERVRTENDLRLGKIAGIVCTSAAETGVDFSKVTQVVCSTLPETDHFVQQAGRVRKDGHVTIFERGEVLDAMKGTVQARLEGAPKKIVLYQKNPKVLAEEAVCIIEEMNQLGATYKDLVESGLFSKLQLRNVRDFLTKSFHELTEIQQAAIPRHEEETDAHHFHGLRSKTDGPVRNIMIFESKLKKSVVLGEVTQGQTIRAALPGMKLLLRRRLFAVKRIGPRRNSPVMVRPLSREEYLEDPRTRAMVRTRISTALHDLRVQSYSRGDEKIHALRMKDLMNFIAECRLTVEQTAEGFVERKFTMEEGRHGNLRRTGKKITTYIYDPTLRAPEVADKRVSSTGMEISTIYTPEFGPPLKSSFETTGVVIRIGDQIFGRTAEEFDKNLGILANLMVRALCAEFDINPSDVGAAVNTTTVHVQPRTTVGSRSITIYDKTPGGLNLSSNIFRYMDRILGRMLELTDHDDVEQFKILEAFMDWQERRRPGEPAVSEERKKMRLVKVLPYEDWSLKGLDRPKANDNNRRMAFLPGSEVYWNKDGEKKWVRVVNAFSLDWEDNPKAPELYYNIEDTGKEQNPYLQKAHANGANGANGSSHPHGKKMEKRCVRAGELERPASPTFQLGYYDMNKKRYERDQRELVVVEHRKPRRVLPKPREVGFVRASAG